MHPIQICVLHQLSFTEHIRQQIHVLSSLGCHTYSMKWGRFPRIDRTTVHIS